MSSDATRHVWDWHMDWRDQAACWCQPFVSRPELADVGLSPHVFHRPYVGCVFRQYGEQGPYVEAQAADVETFEGVDIECDPTFDLERQP